jgi:Zn-finger nucleic acid-binding protein
MGQRLKPCPKCRPAVTLHEEKAHAPSGDVTIDRCPKCAGIWLDTFELEVLRTLQAVVVGAYGGMSASVRRDQNEGHCPCCDGAPALIRVDVGAFGVDFCKGCEGMFFDPGELGPILNKVGHEELARALAKLD